jgi:hypothetical protein
MIADLKPYPAMKDSGVPWLGEVPEYGEVRKLRTRGKLCAKETSTRLQSWLASVR